MGAFYNSEVYLVFQVARTPFKTHFFTIRLISSLSSTTVLPELYLAPWNADMHIQRTT